MQPVCSRQGDERETVTAGSLTPPVPQLKKRWGCERGSWLLMDKPLCCWDLFCLLWHMSSGDGSRESC